MTAHNVIRLPLDTTVFDRDQAAELLGQGFVDNMESVE